MPIPSDESEAVCVVCSSSSPATVECKACNRLLPLLYLYQYNLYLYLYFSPLNRLLYCSSSCQMRDSSSTSHTCLPYSVLFEPRCGRLLIAARDISAGEVGFSVQ